jgi:hypothetical protein
MTGPVQPGWSVRRKSGYDSNSFAHLTAASGSGHSTTEPLPAATFGTSLFLRNPIRVSIHHPQKLYDGSDADAVTGVMHRCDR